MVHQLCQIRGETACTEEDCNSGPSGHPLNCEAASAREDWSSAAHDSFEGRPVVRPPEQLRLHPAMQELDLIDIVDELNKATEVTGRLAVEPILLATDGTLLSGFGRWQLAVFEGRRSLNCVEYPFDENDSL